MRSLGIKGVVRGKKVITTNPDTSLPCPDDKVNRLFKAANSRRVGQTSCGVVHCGAIGPSPMDDDFTYVPTWSGTVYVAFVIDVFARRIVALRDLPGKSLSGNSMAHLDIHEDTVCAPLSADCFAIACPLPGNACLHA